ncbi:hypothetical protein GUI12_03265 [Anaplasmataceae bacterium AB001_6]|nr:hypothetical protein GUI12_03265 [Anaplasmataceae bacterium AB001_6]
MLGIGWTELLVIAVVFLIFIDPKSAPALIGGVKSFCRRFWILRKEMLSFLDENASHDKAKPPYKRKGLDGKYYESYIYDDEEICSQNDNNIKKIITNGNDGEINVVKEESIDSDILK